MSYPNLMPFQDLPFNGDSHICEEFLNLKYKFNLNVVIETGSCLYSTTVWLAQHFKKVYTVEINYEFAKYGLHKLSEYNNIYHKIDQSQTFLNEILKNEITVNDNCIFFLDAHWETHCPLLDELNEISNIKTKNPPIITIHDFKTNNPNHGYDWHNNKCFDLDYIKNSINHIESKLNFKYSHYYNNKSMGANRGIIYLYPSF